MNDNPTDGNAVLDQMALAVKTARELEQLIGKEPGPEMDLIIKVFRSLILNLSARIPEQPETIKQVSELMKHLMENAALEEKRKAREFAEQKHRDLLAGQADAPAGGAIPVEIYDKVERDQNLM